MNSKLFPKKSLKRLPLRTSFVQNSQILASTSRPNSIYSAISFKPISVEEHNKVLIQNQRLAKENSLLKTQFSKCKETLRLASNENIGLKQRLSATETEIGRLKLELKDKRVGIDSLKQKINKFGDNVEAIKEIINSCQQLVIYEEQSNRRESTDRFDTFESFCTTNEFIGRDSQRFSLSSQDRDIRRRLSSDQIKRDFHGYSELSTILELSREHRISSLGSLVTDGSNPIVSGVDSAMSSGVTASTSTSTSTTTSVLVKRSLSSGKIMSTVGAKVAKKTKNVKSKAQKVKSNTKKEMKPKKTSKEKLKKSEMNSNDCNTSLVSVYDFNEDEGNKENIMPVLKSQTNSQPKRQSKRIRSKNV